MGNFSYTYYIYGFTYIAIDIITAYGMYQTILPHMIAYRETILIISTGCRFEYCKTLDKEHYEKC